MTYERRQQLKAIAAKIAAELHSDLLARNILTIDITVIRKRLSGVKGIGRGEEANALEEFTVRRVVEGVR